MSPVPVGVRRFHVEHGRPCHSPDVKTGATQASSPILPPPALPVTPWSAIEHNYRRRHLKNTLPGDHNAPIHPTHGGHGLLIPLQLLRRTGPLQREQLPLRPNQRQTPPGQLRQRRHGARSNYIGTSNPLPNNLLLSPPSNHVDPLELKLVDDLLKPGTPPRHGLQEHHLHIGPGNSHGNPGQPGPRPNIHHRHPRCQELGHHSGVQDVPLPHPLHLPRPNQPAKHPLLHKHLPEPLRHPKPLSKHPSSHLGYHHGHRLTGPRFT